MGSRFDDAIDNMRLWLGRRYGEIDQLGAGEAAALLDGIRQVVADAKLLDDALSVKLAPLARAGGARGGVVVTDGLESGAGETIGDAAPVIKSTGGKPKREWDDAELLAAVLARSRDMTRMDDDGVRLEDDTERTARVLGLVWPLKGDKARLTVLREQFGLDPEHFYATVGYTGAKVQVTR